MKELKKERKKENTRKLVLLALVVNVLLYGSWHLNVLTVWLNDNSLNRETMPSSWSTINNCRVNQYLSTVSQNTCCLTLSSLADYNLYLFKLVQNLTSAKKSVTSCSHFAQIVRNRSRKSVDWRKKGKKKWFHVGAYLHQLSYSNPINFFSKGCFILLQFSQLKQ